MENRVTISASIIEEHVFYAKDITVSTIFLFLKRRTDQRAATEKWVKKCPRNQMRKCPSPGRSTRLFKNRRNKRRYRRATITSSELVKRLESCVGGNVKVSEWPIQCTVASGQTGPRCVYFARSLFSRERADRSTWNRKRGDFERQENGTQERCEEKLWYTSEEETEKGAIRVYLSRTDDDSRWNSKSSLCSLHPLQF